MQENNKSNSIFNIAVLVAALGYFVDIYDLLLFNIVRVDSLGDNVNGLGHAASLVMPKIAFDEMVKKQGEFIISIQMIGLLVGGILWGILGDKKGRLSVLFGSIILYSVANIVNGFVQTPNQYAFVRFVAGIGLAGELGAGITLVSELVSKEKRGIVTSLVAGIGLTGAVFAYFISLAFDWRTCYFIGGGMGFCLLFLRVSVFESGMYKQVKDSNVVKGNILMFFTNAARFKKYICAILIGLPTWYVIGILLAFSNNFAEKFGISEAVLPKKSTMFAYIFIAIADVLIGLISQWLKSRKKAILIFYILTIIGIVLYFNQHGGSASAMYAICAFLGFATGFWALFVTMAAEQFGTNLRATATTTAPNMVRGALPLLIILLNWFKDLLGGDKNVNSYVTAAIWLGVIVVVISITALYFTKETFGKDLNFVEE
jgi:MFS transporter, putative metabolite:H+ symporter